MKEIYKSSEIIFGSREKLLELQRKLHLLKELTDISDCKEIKDIYYYCIKEDKLDPRIRCVFEQNPRTLRGIIDFLKKDILTTYVYGGNISDVVVDGNGKYKLSDNTRRFVASIKDENQQKYKEIVEELINSKFYKNFTFGSFEEEDTSNVIQQDTDEICVIRYIEPKPMMLSSCLLIYTPSSDIITVLADKNVEINQETISLMFDVGIDARLLSDYQKSLIDNTKSSTKPIFFDGQINAKKRVDLSIDEHNDSIILRKVKK